jgi:dynein heavy chain
MKEVNKTIEQIQK